MDFLIFLILAGVALVFRWLTNQASEEKEKSAEPRPNEQRTPAPTQSEEERVRKFLEALGVPPGTRPPPPVKPRSVQPRRVITGQPPATPRKVRRTFVQPLPPLVTTPAERPTPPLTSKAGLPPPIAEAVVVRQETLPEAVPPPSLLPVEQLATTPTAIPSPAFLGSLGGLLRSRSSLRQAIILREVLGPPRGLQPLEQS